MTIAPPDLRRQAADPATSQETLGELAHRWPDLRPVIALNPSTYDGLGQWLGSLDDHEVDTALRRRFGVPDVVVPAAVPIQIQQPAFAGPPTAWPATPTVARTNTFAVLSLIFGILGGVLGIVFGHVARAQIRRTGENGWGMTTAGLVLGYLSSIAGLIFWIAYFAFYANLYNSIYSY